MRRPLWILLFACVVLLLFVVALTRGFGDGEATRAPLEAEAPRASAEAVLEDRAPELEGPEATLAPLASPGRAEVERDASGSKDWRPGDALTVRLVDFERQPVPGVPVQFFRGPARGRPAATVQTDAQGRAVFHEARLGAWARLSVRAVPPLLDPVTKSFTRETLPDHPIGLRIESCGKLVVAVRDGRGRPVSPQVKVSLGLLDPDEAADPGRALARTTIQRSAFEGEATFLLPGGRRLEVLAKHDASFASVPAELDGPSEGAVVRVELAFGAHPILHLRAVTESGEPLGGELVSVHSDARARSIRAGKDGKLIVYLEERALSGVGLSLMTTTKQYGRLVARLNFPLLSPGRLDLGDVVFEPSELLAAGLAVDGAGEPVPEFLLSWGEDGGAGLGGRTVREAGGVFELRGAAPARFRIQAFTNAGLASESTVVERGTRGLVLRLEPTGSLHGSVRLPEDQPVRNVRGMSVQLTRSDTGDEVARRVLNTENFGFQGLRVGLHAVRILVGGVAVAEVGGVAVVAGEESRDPRLNPLQVVPNAEWAVHRIVYSPAAPRGGTVRFGPTGSPPSAWRVAGMGGRSVLLASDSVGIDGELRANNHFVTPFSDVRGYASLELEPLRPLRVAFDGADELPGLPWLVTARLCSGGDDVGSPSQMVVSPTGAGATLQMNVPGPYEVRWRLHRVFAGEDRAVPVEVPSDLVETVESADGTLLRVSVPLEAILDAQRAW